MSYEPGGPPTISDQWHYVQDGVRRGPVADPELLGLITSGRLPRHSAVWHPGMAEWRRAQDVPALAALLPPPPPHRPTSDVGTRLLIPIDRSPWAIVSGYLGLVGILPLCAPAAIVTGVIAIRHIRGNDRMHGMGRAVFGILAGLVFTVGYAVVIIRNLME